MLCSLKKYCLGMIAPEIGHHADEVAAIMTWNADEYEKNIEGNYTGKLSFVLESLPEFPLDDYRAKVGEIAAAVRPSPLRSRLTFLKDPVVPTGYDGPLLAHLLYVGVPPMTEAANPLQLKETFVVAVLPADVCVRAPASYMDAFWWLSDFQTFKRAYESPVGTKQLFNFGPLCPEILCAASSSFSQTTTTWTERETGEHGAAGYDATCCGEDQD